MSADFDTKPYWSAAGQYWDAGWTAIPVSVRSGTKQPAIEGVTGGKNPRFNRQGLARLMRQRPTSELGLWLTPGIMGLDVDAYDGKAGTWSLAAMQKWWGKLPATWMSSSRTDGSGIRLFRLRPEWDQALLRDPKCDDERFGGIEVIRSGHRYAMAWPSRHPRAGRPRYDWFDPDRYRHDTLEDGLPAPDDMAFLPDTWWEGLAVGSAASWSSGGDTGAVQIRAGDDPTPWLQGRPGGTEQPCGPMADDLNRYVAEVALRSQRGGCYDAAREGALALVGNAAEGHRGAWRAICKLGNAYIAAMRENRRRSERAVRIEFRRAVSSAISKLPASKIDDEDPCTWAGLWKPTLAAAA